MPTVIEATRDVQRRLGLTTVFGNPGTTEVPFLSDWPDDFRYVLGLQESVVVGMADGYAQLTGRPVLVNLHSAGGVGHGLGAVFSAYRSRTPLIVLAGQQARPLLGGEPFLGATDAPAFPRPYVRWAREPATAAEVPAALLRAHHHAATAPRGPVFLSVPVDDWDATIDPPGLDVEPVAGPGPDPGAIAAIAAALAAAAAPVLVVGAGVDADGAVEDLVTLAERARAPVWAAPLAGRCSFPEDHPLFAGFLDPERGAVAAALCGYDLAVVLGAPAFTYHVLREGEAAPLPPLVLVDEDPDVLARAPRGRRVLAPVGAAVRALAAAVPETARPHPPARARPERPRPSPTAEFVCATVADALPAGAVVVEEAPTHRGAVHDHLPIRTRGGGFLTTASGSLGFGIAATVGAALARPDAAVVGLIGDGSAMYGIQALWTAAREGVDVVFVILDNGAYRAVELLGAAAGGGKLPGTTLGGIDFVAVATGLGCAARRVDDPAELEPALRAALAEPGPTLLHVPVAAGSPALY